MMGKTRRRVSMMGKVHRREGTQFSRLCCLQYSLSNKLKGSVMVAVSRKESLDKPSI